MQIPNDKCEEFRGEVVPSQNAEVSDVFPNYMDVPPQWRFCFPQRFADHHIFPLILLYNTAALETSPDVFLHLFSEGQILVIPKGKGSAASL